MASGGAGATIRDAGYRVSRPDISRGRIRAKAPQIHIIGATVTTALGSSSAAHGFPEQDQKRRALNDFIRTSGLFDGVIDFDKTTLDPASGGLKPEFVPESTTGGPGDKLHPNRTGYLTMGMVIDLDLFKPKPQAKRQPSVVYPRDHGGKTMPFFGNLFPFSFHGMFSRSREQSRTRSGPSEAKPSRSHCRSA